MRNVRGTRQGSSMNLTGGLIGSVSLHLVAVIIALLGARSNAGKFVQPMVYSVTIEAGKKLGGISQVPKDKKSIIAPPKNVSKPLPKKVETSKAPESATPKKVEKPEVSIPKKVEKKPTPKPTAAPKPKATPKSKAPTAADLNKQLEAAVQRYTGESSAAGGSGFGSGRVGGNSMGGGVVRPPEFFTYKDALEAHIKSEWRWYDKQASLQAQVGFNMDENGEIYNVKILTNSGVREFDDSVFRAVVKANPAPAPPRSVYEFFREVRITFDPRD